MTIPSPSLRTWVAERPHVVVHEKAVLLGARPVELSDDGLRPHARRPQREPAVPSSNSTLSRSTLATRLCRIFMRGRLSILCTANSRRDSSNSDRISPASTIDTLMCCARSGKDLRRRGRDSIHPQCPRRASRRRGDAPRQILLHKVVQLGRELDAGGPPAHHHRVQQPLYKGLVVAGLRCRLKVVNNVPANALGVLDLRHPPAPRGYS